jgi:hypothetical protein
MPAPKQKKIATPRAVVPGPAWRRKWWSRRKRRRRRRRRRK